MISVMPAPAARSTSWLPTPNTVAAAADAPSTPTCPTWRCRSATIPTASSRRPFAWSSKTDCRIAQPVGTCGATTGSSSPGPRFRTGSRPPGKKKAATLSTTYLDDALHAFSGYSAIDEVYDGPFCILSVVDNRRYNRLVCRVLEHDPTNQDVHTFLSDFKKQLDARGLVVRGITTDGSSLYPTIFQELWPKAAHQLCEFHVLKEINRAILHALARSRKQIQASIPKLKRGRPRTTDKARTRRIKRQKAYVAELFDQRHLFVRHHLSAARKKVLARLVRGQPQLRTLREIMDAVYRLFDRRCRMRTALSRLAKLRVRVGRFKKVRRTLSKLFAPGLEKALVFLDDKLLGATSNAVERSNRRFRKAQQSIYSVRTKRHIEQRLALDMYREQQATTRAQALESLHRARSPTRWRKNRPLPRDEPQSMHSCC